MNEIDSTTLQQNKQRITKLFLFDNENLKAVQNKFILTPTVEPLHGTKRFKTSLFN